VFDVLFPYKNESFKYLNYPTPSVAFRYVYMNPSIIYNYTIEDLNSQSWFSIFFDKVPFDQIKGFETFAANMKSYDGFAMKEHSKEIQTALYSCWNKYKTEYDEIYSKSTYTFRIEYPNEKVSLYKELGKNNYDINSDILTIETIGFKRSVRSLPISDYQVSTWQANYICNFEKRSSSKFPDLIKIKIPIETAKKLFSGEGSTWYETILTVFPTDNYISTGKAYGEPTVTSGFQIIKIVNNFYRDSQWDANKGRFIGTPVFQNFIESSIELPLGDFYYRVYIKSLGKSIGIEEIQKYNVDDVSRYNGTYLIYDEVTSQKKGEIVLKINPINSKVDVSYNEILGRSGVKKQNIPDCSINGNTISSSSMNFKLNFVIVENKVGIQYMDKQRFVFAEKSK
jgi:hypothetical protein